MTDCANVRNCPGLFVIEPILGLSTVGCPENSIIGDSTDGDLDTVSPCGTNLIGTAQLPAFADTEYHLAANSTAIDAGDNSVVPIGLATDLDGGARIQNGNAGGTPTVDLGYSERSGTGGTGGAGTVPETCTPPVVAGAPSIGTVGCGYFELDVPAPGAVTAVVAGQLSSLERGEVDVALFVELFDVHGPVGEVQFDGRLGAVIVVGGRRPVAVFQDAFAFGVVQPGHGDHAVLGHEVIEVEHLSTSGVAPIRDARSTVAPNTSSPRHVRGPWWSPTRSSGIPSPAVISPQRLWGRWGKSERSTTLCSH